MDVPSSIPADGSDVSVAFNAFLASVPDSTVLTFPPGATYRIEDTLEVAGKNGLTIEGNGAEFYATTGGFKTKKHSLANRSHLKFVGGEDIVVRDLNITGANRAPGKFSPKFNSQHGIMFCGVDGGAIEDCRITNTYGDGVYLGNFKPGRINGPCTGIVVEGCLVQGAGRQGMTCNYGQGITFETNTIHQTAFTTFDFEPDSAKTPCSNIAILNNVIGTHGAVFVAARGRAPVDHVEIAGNVATVSALGVQVGNDGDAGNICTGWEIHDNHSTHPNGSTRYFGFTNTQQVQVYDNDLRVHGTAVRLNACTTTTIHDNAFHGAKQVMDIRQPGQRWYAGPSTDCTEQDNTVTP